MIYQEIDILTAYYKSNESLNLNILNLQWTCIKGLMIFLLNNSFLNKNKKNFLSWDTVVWTPSFRMSAFLLFGTYLRFWLRELQFITFL